MEAAGSSHTLVHFHILRHIPEDSNFPRTCWPLTSCKICIVHIHFCFSFSLWCFLKVKSPPVSFHTAVQNLRHLYTSHYILNTYCSFHLHSKLLTLPVLWADQGNNVFRMQVRLVSVFCIFSLIYFSQTGYRSGKDKGKAIPITGHEAP
jgi:hypothetical protein